MSLCPGVGGFNIGLIGLSGGGWICTLNPAAGPTGGEVEGDVDGTDLLFEDVVTNEFAR